MDKLEDQCTPTKIPKVDTENITTPDQNTPPPPLPLVMKLVSNQKSQSPVMNSGKTGTPDRLKVPKAFKFPERYTSPTDQMMSPITRGILARSRKGSKLLPPSARPKLQVQEQQQIHELSRLQIKNC